MHLHRDFPFQDQVKQISLCVLFKNCLTLLHELVASNGAKLLKGVVFELAVFEEFNLFH